jgi:hypothetical protein
MISLAVALTLTNLIRPIDGDTFITFASDHIWVYPNATDPAGDETLKIWGVGGKAVAPTPADSESFGYGYIKFDLKGLPSGKKLVGAWMILTPFGTPEIDKNAKDYPLEVRPLNGKFTGKTWSYDQAATVNPSATEIFGSGIIAQADGTTSKNRIEIKCDLMGTKSKFAETFAKALATKEPMFFALTSKYDASELGRQGIYKIFASDRPESSVLRAPQLVLKFE